MKKVDNSVVDNDRIDDDHNATKQVHSGYMALSLNLYNLPKIIDVAWYKAKVRPISQTQCGGKIVKSSVIQKTSAKTKLQKQVQKRVIPAFLPPHSDVQNTRIQCANCSEKHSSSDRNCPRYVQQKKKNNKNQSYSKMFLRCH